MTNEQPVTVDHSSPVAAYVQLMNYFSDAIKRGEYKLGDKLPSENDICRKFGVSRTTVRQALQLMSQQDLVFSVHGRGTFVKAPAISNELTRITSFSQVLQQKGLDGRTYIHAFNSDISQGHPLMGKDVVSLELLGYISNAPVVYYRSYFHSDLGNKMLEAAKEAEGKNSAFSTYDLYEKLGVVRSQVDQTIRAINASEELAEILHVPVGMALITLESVNYSPDGTALEYKTGYYRSDIYSFNVQRNI